MGTFTPRELPRFIARPVPIPEGGFSPALPFGVASGYSGCSSPKPPALRLVATYPLCDSMLSVIPVECPGTRLSRTSACRLRPSAEDRPPTNFRHSRDSGSDYTLRGSAVCLRIGVRSARAVRAYTLHLVTRGFAAPHRGTPLPTGRLTRPYPGEPLLSLSLLVMFHC